MTAPLRSLRLALVVTLTVVVLGWVARTSWRELHQLRGSFGAVEGDSFHLSDYIEGPIRNMNEAVLEHALRGDESSRAKFLRNGEELKQRLRVHHSGSFTTPEEREVVTQIEAALKVYLAQGLKLMGESQGGRA